MATQLTSINEIRSAARDGLMLNVNGETVPAQTLYHSSLRGVVDQIKSGAISQPSDAEYLADLNSRWTAMRADIVAAALRAADKKAS